MINNPHVFWSSRLPSLPYDEAFNLQIELRKKKLEKKIPHLLLLTSHPPVYTLGRRDCRADLLSTEEEIRKNGIEIFQANRGGRITYHGPGQIVGYFIADIRNLKLGVGDFVRQVEELLIQTLEGFGLKTHRDPEYPGVWIEDRKIAALGLHFDRGVSMHGFSLNVSVNLDHYQHIIPCGIVGRTVTSMEKELHHSVSIKEVEGEIEKKLGEVFQCAVTKIDVEDLSLVGI